MRNEIKAELSRIFVLRSMEELKSSAGKDEDELSGLVRRLETQFHLLNNYRDSLKYNDHLIGLFRGSLSSALKVRNSARWKIGNGMVSIVEWLLGRKNKEPALKELIETNRRVIEDSKKMRPDLEPPHYLNTDYLLKPRSFKTTQSPKDGTVAIIILNYDRLHELQSLFDSFQELNTYKRFKFVVVDHNSTDDNGKLLKKYSDRLPLSVVNLDSNSSFSYSNNYAADIAGCEYLLFLSSELIFIDDIIGKMVDELEGSKHTGIVGGTLHLPGEDGKKVGSLKHSGISFRYHKQEVENQSTPIFYDEPVESIKPSNEHAPMKNERQQVPAITSDAMMIRRSDFITLKGFDENYIGGFENVDLCLNCKRELGKEVVMLRKVRMIRGRSTNGRKIVSTARKIRESHNLRLLNHKHGIYIKQKYLKDLKEKKTNITADTVIPGFISRLYAANERSLRIAIKNPAPSGPGAENWGDTHFARSLAKALQKKGFDTRVDFFDEWYDSGYLYDDIVIALRGNRRYYPQPGQLNVMWNISHPELVTGEEYEGYDHIFVPSKKYCEELSNDLSTRVSVLLQCTDPESFYPVEDDLIQGEQYLFVGNSRGHYRKAVKLCIENNVPVSVFGKGWDKIIPSGYIKASYIANNELKKYYSSCKVLFNDHWDDMASKGFISNRLFDAVACECTVISDKVEGIEEIFGDSVLVYDTEEEFRELVWKVRNEPGKLRSGSTDYALLIREEHSFDARAIEIDKIIRKLIEDRLWSAGK